MKISRKKPAALAAAGALAVLAALSSPASASLSTSTTATAAAKGASPQGRPVCAADDAKTDCMLRVKPSKPRSAKASVKDAPPGGLTAADLQDAYKLPSDLLGGGSTIAVVVPFGNTSAEKDLAIYRAASGMHACDDEFPCFRRINQQGGTTPPPASLNWTLHAAVGLDMASAACPNCRLLLVEADDDTLANQGTAVDQAVAQGARTVVVMNGWFPEYEGQDAQAAHFDHKGVAIVAASGNSYFNGGGREALPAAYPSVVAVGGTNLYRDPSAKRGWAETAWRSTTSGCSLYEKRPAWQRKGDCGDRRTVADVAAVAADYTPVAAYDSANSGWVQVSGAPVASALIAGVYGLAGNTSSTPAPRRLYSSARYLFDLTSGANGSCAGSYLCTAGRGYDGPSGMGAPNGTGAF
ncbi:hypothetical protein J4573_05740 [Actinomadura barringtoniae]|uniref:Peptidase S8 n=1 Tax=Actinomadura barringtoniae TaxID=1427535 RepID=A0A939PAT4_9ACTN|nr:S8 family serine peptidase [Actinomadura barringtoniae]MBO2446583.1 hypothetical protein [Actinomadura barringtoniae]